MSTFKILLVILTLGLLTSGCKNSTIDKKEKETKVVMKEDHQHDDAAISLNNGKKWKVDSKMMEYILNIKTTVAADTIDNKIGYENVAKKINSNIELLTSNCTMSGQAHDELHKWLLPFIDLSEAFSASKTDQAFEKNYHEIKKSFTIFNTYFE